jgi:hypothetical protein
MWPNKISAANVGGTSPQQPTRQPGFWIAGAIITTVLLWGLSVALPVWETRSDQTGDWAVVRGVIPALLGWLGLLVKCPAWFANLLLIPLCIMFFKGRSGGFVLSLVALALAASAYAMPGIYGDNEEAVIVRRLIGFYCWLGSFLTIALAHAFLSTAAQRKWIVARVAVVTLMVVAMVGLEWICPVRVSPLEAALKTPNDVTSLTATLARHPPQAEKDVALWWAIRQDLSAGQRAPSKRVTLLIAAGANPNKADKFGTTLLMRAMPPRGSESLVELLIQAGADVNARDHRGKTVLEIAQEIGSSPECQKLLVNAGARTSGQPKG